MKKQIVIETDDFKEKNETIVKKDTSIKNKFVIWIINMIGYTLSLIIVSKLFSSFYINTSKFGIYAFLAAIIINILNQTIKPFLKTVTLFLTILSYGLFYPFINVIILYLTSFIMGSSNFHLNGLISPIVVSFFISFVNLVVESIIIKPLIYKEKIYE